VVVREPSDPDVPTDAQTVDSAATFLLDAALRGERGMAWARLSGFTLFLLMLVANVHTGVRPVGALLVAGPALLLGIMWSVVMLRRIRLGRLTEGWLVSSAVLDGVVATITLVPTVWWPRPDYSGLATQPTAAAFLVALATVPLRLSMAAARLGVLTMLAGCAVLVWLDQARHGAETTHPDAFFTGAILMTMMALVALLMAAWIRATVARGMTAVQQGEKAKSRLGAYLSPEIAREVMELTSTSQRRSQHQAAVLFSDLRGFTQQGEALPPEQLIAELNAYFEVMVAAVQANGGVVDKFMGDALMAVFGVPHPTDDSGARAVRAALAMEAALVEHNRARAALGLRPLRHGIGVHFGPVVAGDVGSAARRQYTVIGDTVNVAARIEALTKQFGCSLLLSSDVVDELPHDDPLRAHLQRLGEVEVRGRVGQVALWTLPTRG
jgi:class 3 adenylate cyclase